MKTMRFCAVIVTLFAMGAANAADTDEWAVFSRALSLMQGFLQIPEGVQNDPNSAGRQLDGLLSGNNTDANRLLNDAFEGMPVEQRRQVLGIARQLATMGQRQAAQERQQLEEVQATQARKHLNDMGLSYFDRQQFIDAVKRNDMIAVRLFCAGRGVDTGGAREIARKAGLAKMEQLLAGEVVQKR